MDERLKALEQINSADKGIIADGRILGETAPWGVLIEISGKLDNYNSNIFTEHVSTIISENSSIDVLIIDMKEINYVSSTGIGSLTNLLIQTHKFNIEFKIARAGEKIKSLIDLLGFTSFFQFVDDLNIIRGD